MKQDEIDAVLSWLTASFGRQINPDARPVWEAKLADLDPAEAMAVAMRYKPSAGQFMPTPDDFRRDVRNLSRPQPDESWRELPAEKLQTPTWVHVLKWMRSHDDFRSLPQQARPRTVSDPHDPRPLTAALTMIDYEELERKWEAAGSPKTTFDHPDLFQPPPAPEAPASDVAAVLAETAEPPDPREALLG